MSLNEFSFQFKGTVDYYQILRAIWADLKNLNAAINNQIERLNSSDKPPNIQKLKNFTTQIEKYQNNLVKGLKYSILDEPSTELLERITSGNSKTQIQTILTIFSKLPQQLTTAGIKEHRTHLSKHIIEMNEIIANSGKKPLKETKQFNVMHWHKSDIHTLLLGDYWGCCLSTDGGQFPAMVQRRCDAAMMMHAVIDIQSGEPVSGNWLFFASDKNKPDDIYVVASFFEIRASYGLKKELRDEMVKQLLLFTGRYAKAINTKGLLIRPLTYGIIPDFGSLFDKKKISIEKIGGFYSPSYYNGGTHAHYYLDALNLDEFYLFSEDKILTPQQGCKQSDSPHSIWNNRQNVEEQTNLMPASQMTL